MTYVKSILAGIAAVAILAIASPFVFVPLTYYLNRKQLRAEENAAIGWDPVSMLRTTPLAWIIILLVFVGGFYWQYRRSAR